MVVLGALAEVSSFGRLGRGSHSALSITFPLGGGKWGMSSVSILHFMTCQSDVRGLVRGRWRRRSPQWPCRLAETTISPSAPTALFIEKSFTRRAHQPSELRKGEIGW